MSHLEPTAIDWAVLPETVVHGRIRKRTFTTDRFTVVRYDFPDGAVFPWHAHPESQATIVLAGTPAYGRTGGGVFIWDREAQRGALLRHDEIAPLQSTMSLLARPEGNVLGGTTIAAGTGGEAKAKEAELYLLDAGKRRVVWRMVPFAGAQSYTDLGEGPRGLVYGFVDRTRFFVFDPAARRVVHSEELKEKFGSVVTGQGPRALLRDERGRTFVLFNRALARVDDANFSITEISRPPVAITAGGDILAGRLYFAAGSHMCSIALPE